MSSAGVHQVLAARQGPLMAGTPLTLAETASVFGEQLTFRALLDATDDPVQRRVMLAGKIEDALNTVVRQIAFVEFERRVHDARKEAELTADELGRIWLECPDGEPWPGVPLRRLLSGFLELHPALRPCAVLRLRLRVRRLPGELALCGLQAEPRASRSAISRCCAPAARCVTRSCWRRSAWMPRIPGFWSKGLGMIEQLIDELDPRLAA